MKALILLAGVIAATSGFALDVTEKCSVLKSYILKSVEFQGQEIEHFKESFDELQKLFVVENLKDKEKFKEAVVKLKAVIKDLNKTEANTKTVFKDLAEVLERANLTGPEYESSKQTLIKLYERIDKTDANLKELIPQLLNFLKNTSSVNYHIVEDTVLFDDFPSHNTSMPQTQFPQDEAGLVQFNSLVGDIRQQLKDYGEEWEELSNFFNAKKSILQNLSC